jgi:hypothetical protein
MNFVRSFFSSKRSELHQSYFNKLPPFAQAELDKKATVDQEKLLDTFSKQSDDRIHLICLILGQQSEEVMGELFKKETRLLNALLKVDTTYLENASTQPDYVESVIMKEKQDRENKNMEK